MNPVVLIVLDGFGLAPPGPGNPVSLANTENINSYLYTFPNTTLKASGEPVGLPSGEVGNTEVGHLNLGAGRVVYQDLPRINMSITDGNFYKNPVFLKTIEFLKNTNGNLHIMGLVSEGSVHSDISHLYALINFAKTNNFGRVFIHAITDGRDSSPKSSGLIIKQIEDKLKEYQVGQIASIMGRYFAMDRDLRWERTEKAYVCLTKGTGNKANTAEEAIENSYKEGKTDEFIDPSNILINNSPVLIKEGDAVIFFNYRIDRPRQLTKAFVLENFEKDANKMISFDPYEIKYHKTHLQQKINSSPVFNRGPKIKNLLFITMTEYEKNLQVDTAYPPFTVKLPLSKVLSEYSLNQLHMAESEKERFVTFYFNGLKDQAFVREERVIVASPKVATYDLKPEMSSYELTDVLIKNMRSQKYKFILINYANTDMVGHTGNLDASIKAVKAVDTCLKKAVDAGLDLGYTIIITADHGNIEQKINPKTGQVSTEHTGNPVPFIVISKALQGKYMKLQSGILADVAPTILKIMGIPQPSDMTGRNLLEEVDF